LHVALTVNSLCTTEWLWWWGW